MSNVDTVHETTAFKAIGSTFHVAFHQSFGTAFRNDARAGMIVYLMKRLVTERTLNNVISSSIEK